MTKEKLAELMRDVFTKEVAPLISEALSYGSSRGIWKLAMQSRDNVATFLRDGRDRPSGLKNLTELVAALFAFRFIIDKEENGHGFRADDVFENEIMALREAGQKEYAHDENNAFANFERASEDLGIDRKQILWVFAMKHRDGIQSYIDGHRSQRENVRGRVNDLIVYSLILRGMIEEEQQ
jgi:hypothetical protein